MACPELPKSKLLRRTYGGRRRCHAEEKHNMAEPSRSFSRAPLPQLYKSRRLRCASTRREEEMEQGRLAAARAYP
jgi:hypothetical protein